jgi:hypothetical protein
MKKMRLIDRILDHRPLNIIYLFKRKARELSPSLFVLGGLQLLYDEVAEDPPDDYSIEPRQARLGHNLLEHGEDFLRRAFGQKPFY